MELPIFFVDKMRKVFPQEFDLYLNSFNAPAFQGLRANLLKISPDKLCQILGLKLEKVNWCDEGFYYSAGDRPGKSPFYHAGLFYIQEPSAMSAASVLGAKPGERVLDICAAPGGKTTQLAAKLKGEGLIVANDLSNSRCRALLKNIELMGITNAVVLNETPKSLAQKFVCFFDKILIDAPCSGEGMFRKDFDAVKNYTKYKSDQLSVVQKSILYYADKMLKPGGEIMYSTCTFSPEENEMIIGWFLDSHKDYVTKPIDAKFGFDSGNPDFYKESKVNGLANTARLWPHKIKGEGHFLAHLQKLGGGNGQAGAEKLYSKKLPGLKFFQMFCAESLNISFDEKHLSCHGESLYKIPEGLPELDGIRVIRMGFYLGDIRKNRFEPSQALAMSLKKGDAKRFIDFSIDDKNLYRYLKGESFEADCGDGYCLICVEGFSLGFGKVQNGRLKNKYLKSWIMN